MVTSGRALLRYETACRALAETHTVEEAKGIHDQAVAMTAYARLAKNRELEADAIEIRMRATRRLDQLRQAQKETVGLSAGARGSREKGARVDDKPTLASQATRTAPIKRACSAPWMRPRSSARLPRRGMAFSAALSAKPRSCSPSRAPTRPSPSASQGLNAQIQAKNRELVASTPTASDNTDQSVR
jgi:hypothetical protein